MDQIRLRRLEEQLREEIGFLLSQGEVKDPRVGPFVSVTRVEASRDGSHAKVWISAFAGEAPADVATSANPADAADAADVATSGGKRRSPEAVLEDAAAGLTSAAGFIQAQLAKRVRLRLTPKLHFIPDTGIREGFEMTERIKGLFP